ncbi:exodeoxyribonuclease VII large subunit, partial [Bordetella pertussis]|uniref:exodeoxyribonuclease VII large subunit n=1 Tax=Bordetella pertussis TaxID=520 RepID=UPI000B12C0A5
TAEWLARAQQRRLDQAAQRLDRAAAMLTSLLAQLGRAQARLAAARQARLDTLAAQLRALDPQHTLARGYAIVRDAAGAIVTDATRLAARDRIEIAVARGRIGADVTDIGTPDGTDGNPALRRG